MTASAVALALVGCADENPWSPSNGEGKIKVHISASDNVSAAVPDVRAISTEIETPPVADFHIRVSKNDGSNTKLFNSVEEFVGNASFPAGSYSIEAFYGDPSVQGSIESGDKSYRYAYYYGVTENVTVLEGQTTEVQLQASLANSIVSIEYSDEFKNYFSEWNTSLQTDGNSPLNLGAREAMSYLIPGNVSINISAKLPNGKSLTLHPGDFSAEAHHMYKMRYTIYNGEVGNAKLAIEFDDNLESEPFVVDLSDDLESAEAPTVTTDGFVDNQSFASLEGIKFDGVIKFNVLAPGGIAEAKLTVESNSYRPNYLINGSVNLCAADDLAQGQMYADGVKAVGFFKNPGQMAQLDLTELCKHLPEGSHKFIFQITDKYMQTHDPVAVTVSILPTEIAMSTQPAPFGEGYADILVSYNGPDPTAPGANPFSFKIQGDLNYDDVEILSISKANATRSAEFPVHDYSYRISVPECDRDELPVRLYFEGVELVSQRGNIPYIYPDYSLLYDATGSVIMIKIDESDPTANKRLLKKLHVNIDGANVSESSLTRDLDLLTISIPVRNVAGSSYEVKTTLESASTPKAYATAYSLTTETPDPVPNGDFETLTETINTTINQGGTWTHTTLSTAHRYSTTLSMIIKEPNQWYSSNSITCNLSASNLNSWYVIPSVYNTTLTWLSNQPEAKVWGIGQSAYTSTADVYKNLNAASGNNAMVVRNVAWDLNGPEIPNNSQTGNDDFSNYFCNKEPAIANRTAGYLKLGTEANPGIAFTSRPVRLKGVYKYELDATTRDASEKGVVQIKIFSGSNEIGSGQVELEAQANYSEFTVPISYVADIFNKKATRLEISICSSNKSEIITTNYCNKEECCSRGAALTIDNLTFEY